MPDDIREVQDSITQEIIACAHKSPSSATGGGGCHEQCTAAYRIIPQELQFYRKYKIPLPRLCPNCRYYARLAERNLWKLWKRACMCNAEKLPARMTKVIQSARMDHSDGSGGEMRDEKVGYTNTAVHFHDNLPCPNEFETSYAPERKEVVYCEQCYNAEVV